ncbi:hypothetical protein PHO31112_04781 [Pandoraea horticolens]|uniref:Uncharacterized protein n=1 Tax=Pandoraea horticolens TaxID=2508298 RepID=A0A5E4YU16_9BURK|nr:hypothetical protein PHO31112_04781 [Pandoraea horticolens]
MEPPLDTRGVAEDEEALTQRGSTVNDTFRPFDFGWCIFDVLDWRVPLPASVGRTANG